MAVKVMRDPIKLTKSVIAAIQPKADTIEYKFVEPSKLRLRVAPSGTKSFRVVKRLPRGGRLVDEHIGRFGEMPLDDIRRKAQGVIAQISSGIDPKVHREQQKALSESVKANARAFRELWSSYLAEFELRVREGNRSQKSLDDAGSMFRTHIEPVLGNVQIGSLSRELVQGFMSELRQNKSYAVHNKVLKYINAALNHAVKCGDIDHNPAYGIKKVSETARQRVISDDEMKQLAKALELEPQHYRDVFWLLLYTAQRKSNVFAMQWRDVDLTAATWCIKGTQTKGKRAITVPLIEPALAILKRRKEESGPADRFVFPSQRSASGHLVEKGGKGSFWHRVKARAGFAGLAGEEGLRLHDLRRTTGSKMVNDGGRIQPVQKLMGHSSIEITAKNYAHLEVEAVRGGLESVYARADNAGALKQQLIDKLGSMTEEQLKVLLTNVDGSNGDKEK
ncbi:DUF4102 domain-containing protein [Ferrimonas sediminicola]|uniref:DUF4102 domain-containing protein n=1 Tax=Ferrimonas sediminicola TaxID=2569538 RepID=A0A4U1BG56_9GAMM|nr:site-specific integrase [Ferrimonas sediminicola]TKB49930.1 DUF4102 domain-containing protein [Ferrimonas sediminicola]